MVYCRDNSTKNNVFVILHNVRLFFDRNNTTISKFPPILEYVLQRIQTMNSNYVYEDLSRPPTYDSPDFTKTTVTESTILKNTTANEQLQFSTESISVEYYVKNTNGSQDLNKIQATPENIYGNSVCNRTNEAQNEEANYGATPIPLL